jgi:hypothetical protein
MTRRALGGLGAALVVALVLVGMLPGPALANQRPAVTISTPADGATVTTSTVAINGQASMNGGRIDGVTVTIASPDGHPVPAPQSFGGNNSSSLSFPWSPQLTWNGTYTVKADASGTETPVDFNGQEFNSDVNTFKVEAPPATPTGVKATVDQAKRTVTISWAANGEPDIIGYGVYRKEGSDFVPRKSLTATSYTDEIGSLPAGTYQYQVYAARPNADGSQAVVSAPATTAGKVTTSPPPPPTSTTTPAGSSGGSGAGGTTNTTAASSTGSTKPNLASHGKVDLSGFTALLPNGGGKLPASRQTPAPDPGFNETLPFQADGGASPKASSGNGDSIEALGGQRLASSSGDDRNSSLVFLAAGLLVTVLLMHALWLRDEVNREPLPAVAPADPPEPDPA